MTHPGDEYRFTAIKCAIQTVGDFESFVAITAYDFGQGERGCAYKINKALPPVIVKQISDAIENEALRLNLKVITKVL